MKVTCWVIKVTCWVVKSDVVVHCIIFSVTVSFSSSPIEGISRITWIYHLVERNNHFDPLYFQSLRTCSRTCGQGVSTRVRRTSSSQRSLNQRQDSSATGWLGIVWCHVYDVTWVMSRECHKLNILYCDYIEIRAYENSIKCIVGYANQITRECY